MKKYIKLIVFILALLIVYITYSFYPKEDRKLIYIALGDSIAEGMTPNHSIEYGYPDYIADYLKDDDHLSFYTKKYAKSGYKIDNLKIDIEQNKTIEVDGKKYHLKEILRESDIVTITIGANDFISDVSINNISSKLSSTKKAKKEIDNITKNYRELLELVKKYAKNKIIVTGYFNPLPSLTNSKGKIDEIVKYSNNLVEELCDELDIIYVDVFDVLDQNPSSFSNNLDIHPNKNGYQLIAKEIIKKL